MDYIEDLRWWDSEESNSRSVASPQIVCQSEAYNCQVLLLTTHLNYYSGRGCVPQMVRIELT